LKPWKGNPGLGPNGNSGTQTPAFEAPWKGNPGLGQMMKTLQQKPWLAFLSQKGNPGLSWRNWKLRIRNPINPRKETLAFETLKRKP